MALSIEKVRHEMLRGILIPRELVNESLKVVASKLHAKETKFFSFKGRVLDQVEVEDHAIQLQAADHIFSLAGLYARERDSRDSTPGVALEIDSNTGVVRIVVGSPASLEETPTTLELPPSGASAVEPPVMVHAHDIGAVEPRKPRRVAVPDSAWAILSGSNVVHDEVVD